MTDDLVFSASLDESEVLKSLRNIDKNIDKLAKSAEKDFQRVGKASNLSAVKLGAVSGIVQSLTTEFINLGKQAVQSLINVSKEAVNIAAGYETLEARLIGIFDGSQEAADEAFDFIQDRSKELGIDLSELAGAFLPQVENLEQFERVTKIATALARSDPEQGAIGARIALIEALSGTFTSLQRRFEIPAAEIDRLKEAFDTEGIEGFLSTLETVLGEAGKSFEDLAGTATASFDRARIQGQQLLGVMGDPILEELKQQFDDIGQIVSENSDDFELIATAVGQLVSNVINFVGTNFADFLQNLDTEQVLGIVEDFQGIVESARNLAQILKLTKLPQALLDDVSILVEQLNTALMTAVKLSALASAELAREQAEANVALQFGEDPTGAFAGGFGRLTTEQEAEVATAGREAFNRTIQESLDILDENKQITDAYSQSLDDFAQAQQNAGDATTDTADALLAQRQAAKEAAEGLSEETIKALEKMAELEKDAFRARIDIIRKAGQKALDTENEFIEKRLKDIRDFLRDIEDAERKNAQTITDSATDLRRDEEDAYRDFNRDRADLERDSAKERIKVEEDYREDLRKIQQNFSDNADEAARQRDAVTFLRLQRDRDRAIGEARITRDKRVDEARTEAAEKREELNRSLEEQLEDNRIADQRRLEDIQIRLEREYEAARIAHERDLQETLIAEDKKRQELATSLERQLQTAQIANNRRVSDFKGSLDEEVAAMLAAEEEKTAIVREQAALRSSIYQEQLNQAAAPFSVPDYLRRPGRQHGGPVGAGQTVTVGERGPELFQPRVAGNVIPLGPGITSPLAAQNIANTVNNVTNASVNQSMLDPSQQSAMMRAIAANVASETVRRIISG